MFPLLIFAQLGSVQFHANVVPDTVYVGQQVSYDAEILVDDVGRMHLQANPSYTPAEARGVTVYDFPFDTTAIVDITIAGAHYRRYLYHRALFPLSAGTFDIAPSVLQYALPVDESYNSPMRTYTLQSEATRFVVLSPPDAGKPLDFSGAVGQFSDTAYTDGATPRVGDTFVLTVRVNGVGNINLLPRPALNIPWADVIVSEERVLWDSAGQTVRGSKEFDWIVTPKLAGEMIVPAVRYPYFDPTTRRYALVNTAQVNVTVAPPSSGGDSGSAQTSADTIGDSPFPVLLRAIRANAVVVILSAIIVLLLVVVGILLARRRPTAD